MCWCVRVSGFDCLRVCVCQFVYVFVCLCLYGLLAAWCVQVCAGACACASVIILQIAHPTAVTDMQTEGDVMV